MGEIRERKNRRLQALRANERELQDVPQHVESAGDRLIQQLVEKQTCTHTTLQEQLKIHQQFQSEGCSQDQIETIASVQELQKKTGLSRDEIESALSIKPDSEISKLYKFALSNQLGAEKQSDLLANLPNHPINHLKSMEQDLMGRVQKNDKIKKRKKKHRIRKKKKLVEATVAEKPRLRPSLWDVDDNGDKR